jgi:hypothetical protein
VTTEKVTYISIEALIAKNKSVTFSQTHQEFFYANKEGHPVKQGGQSILDYFAVILQKRRN